MKTHDNAISNQDDPCRLLNSAEAAAMLGISASTLANWRAAGKGPDYVRLGAKRSPVGYRREGVISWIDSHTVDCATGLAATSRGARSGRRTGAPSHPRR